MQEELELDIECSDICPRLAIQIPVISLLFTWLNYCQILTSVMETKLQALQLNKLIGPYPATPFPLKSSNQ